MHEYSQMMFASIGIDVNKLRAPDIRAARFKNGSPTSKMCLNIFDTRLWSRAASSARIWVSHHVPALRANAVQQQSL